MKNYKLTGLYPYLVLFLAVALLSPFQAGAQVVAGSVHVNQAGFHPASSKLAVITDDTATMASVIDSSGNTVFSSALPESEYWPHADEEVRVFDFSTVKTTGIYRIQLDSGSSSYTFPINRDALSDVGRIALRSFFMIRSGTELTTELAGPWARAAGHPDTNVIVHESAAGPVREAGAIISSPGGWYDAGDYNKYIVNSAFAVYFMLMPYEICPACFPDGATNIPESGNGKSDLLDEARFNLDWMLSMQDPADGGLYHKLTSKRFSGVIMPADDPAERYVVQKSTAAALDFAAVAAYASRLYHPSDPAYAVKLLEAAKKAWAWAGQNPAVAYQQPADISTGTYARPSDDFADEWSWARVELYLTTGEAVYLEGWNPAAQSGGLPSWSHVGPLAWLSLANAVNAPADLQAIAQDHIRIAANTLQGAAQQGYRVGIGAYDGSLNDGERQRDWVWGSNGVASVQAVMLEQAYRLSEDTAYLDAAVSNLDYLLGRNPNGVSYLTGIGENHTMNPHSRPSQADGVVEPVPGLLAGGPHNGYQDDKDCEFDYINPAPAKSYHDHFCSYATNENAINWNAALVAAAYLVHNSVGVASQLQTLSGGWHDPSHSGEGLVMHNLEGRDSAAVFWFTYDEVGNQRWFVGVGQLEGNQLTANMTITSGGRFGSEFDPGDVSRDPIGTVLLTMNDCDNILLEYEISGEVGVQTLRRTYAVPGSNCTVRN